MSTTIRMVLVMNLLSLLFLIVLVCSHQSTLPLRSFKIGKNITYDCIDIYKQPGLNHPLLKNHKIQMKPTVSRIKFKNHTGNHKTSFMRKIRCPIGTVPILRSTQEFITNLQHLHPLSADSHGTHIAGVRVNGTSGGLRGGPLHGIEAQFNGHNLNIRKDQASFNQIYIGSGLNNQVNYISAGFMINPGFFPDGRVWTYGFWKGKNGKGCYNTACSGFVQVSYIVPIVQPIDLSPGKPDWLHCSIHQDKNTGHWWLTQVGAIREDVGYWPKELFNLFDNGASLVGVGGVVQASPSGSSPPMGNGKFPDENLWESSLFTNILFLNSNYKQLDMDEFDFEELLDSPKCYGLRIGSDAILVHRKMGFYFNYGGPGGNSCGI